MTVWVKEIAGALKVDYIVPLLKNGINIKILQRIEKVQRGDVIIASNRDDNIENLGENYQYTQVYIYEDILKEIAASIYREMKSRHNYYYLTNVMRKASEPSIHTVITGSSHGLFGIDEGLLTHEVNASLTSQDLYYSLRVFYKVCEDNPNIKNVVYCFGYYFLYHDLSLVRIPEEMQRISTVYQPIFKDAHNAVLLPPQTSALLQSDIFDVQKCADAYIEEENKKPYFHQDNPRSANATVVWGDPSKNWMQLSEEEREESGRIRATGHNSQLRWIKTLKENVQLFHESVRFCTQKQINILMVVTPASKYYRRYLDPAYQEAFYDMLNQAEGIIHVLDLYEDESFTNEDFNDTDHLNDEGARKLTCRILEVLRELTNEGES